MITLAIVNQKGGVGKTTTAINLSYYLVKKKKSVLLIDSDPQSNIANCLGINLNREDLQIMNMLQFKDSFSQPANHVNEIIQTRFGIDIIPAKRSLTQADTMSSGMIARERILSESIKALKGTEKYDYIIIDCPPQPGFLNNTAFYAADGLIVTVQAEFLALNAFKTVMDTYNILKSEYGEKFTTKIFGILVTMSDNRLNLSKETTKIINSRFPEKAFLTSIRRNVDVAEAPSHQKPIGEYKPKSHGAIDYESLCKEILHRRKSWQKK